MQWWCVATVREAAACYVTGQEKNRRRRGCDLSVTHGPRSQRLLLKMQSRKMQKAAVRGPAVADSSIPLAVRQRMSRCSDTVPPEQPINSNPKLIADHILQEYHF